MKEQRISSFRTKVWNLNQQIQEEGKALAELLNEEYKDHINKKVKYRVGDYEDEYIIGYLVGFVYDSDYKCPVIKINKVKKDGTMSNVSAAPYQPGDMLSRRNYFVIEPVED